MNNLIIGLDLSFNSTGITITCFDDFDAKTIEFHRVLFDDESSKKGKTYNPTKLKNINNHVYKLPNGLKTENLLLSIEDKNNENQLDKTLQAIMCSKKISRVLLDSVIKYKPTNIIVSIENYIMPSFSGKNQLNNVGALITLQGFVRKFVIQLCVEKNIFLKMIFPTPSSNKKIFSGDGSADKEKMIITFINKYEGNKLIPQASVEEIHKINDVIDSFALMVYAFSKLIKNQNVWSNNQF